MKLSEAKDVVSTPGKFEGQPVYVPLLWELSLDGGSWGDEMESHESFGCIVIFRDLDVEAVKKDDPSWKDYEIPKSVALWEHDDGFITELSVEEADQIGEEWQNNYAAQTVRMIKSKKGRIEKEDYMSVGDIISYAIRRFPDTDWTISKDRGLEDVLDVLSEHEANPGREEYTTYYVVD